MTNPQLDELYRRLETVRAADRRRLKKRLDGLARKFNANALPKVSAAIDASVAARARRAGLAAAPSDRLTVAWLTFASTLAPLSERTD